MCLFLTYFSLPSVAKQERPGQELGKLNRGTRTPSQILRKAKARRYGTGPSFYKSNQSLFLGIWKTVGGTRNVVAWRLYLTCSFSASDSASALEAGSALVLHSLIAVFSLHFAPACRLAHLLPHLTGIPYYLAFSFTVLSNYFVILSSNLTIHSKVLIIFPSFLV